MNTILVALSYICELCYVHSWLNPMDESDLKIAFYQSKTYIEWKVYFCLAYS